MGFLDQAHTVTGWVSNQGVLPLLLSSIYSNSCRLPGMSKLEHLQPAGSEHVCPLHPFQTKLAICDTSQPIATQIAVWSWPLTLLLQLMNCFVAPGMIRVTSVHDTDALALMCNRLSSLCAADLSRCEADGAAMMRQWFAGTAAQWLCRPRSALGGPGQGPAPLLPPAGRECCPRYSVPLITCIQSINQIITQSIQFVNPYTSYFWGGVGPILQGMAVNMTSHL